MVGRPIYLLGRPIFRGKLLVLGRVLGFVEASCLLFPFYAIHNLLVAHILK